MKRILIVEDNEKNLKFFLSLLNSQGYETIEARDGKEGVRLAKDQKPDLILMDIQMPVMDGVTVMKILKENPETKDIPLIALTSYAMKGDKEKFLSEGFVEYIAKPIKVDEFLEVIRRYL